MSHETFDLTRIRADLNRIDATIAELRARSRPPSPPGRLGPTLRDVDLQSLIHKRDRVLTKLVALRLADESRRPRLRRELEDAWIELEQGWARIRLRRVFEKCA